MSTKVYLTLVVFGIVNILKMFLTMFFFSTKGNNDGLSKLECLVILIEFLSILNILNEIIQQFINWTLHNCAKHKNITLLLKEKKKYVNKISLFDFLFYFINILLFHFLLLVLHFQVTHIEMAYLSSAHSWPYRYKVYVWVYKKWKNRTYVW